MTRESGVRIGVVGLGKMGLMPASIFNGLSGSRVVAVAEPTAVMRRAFKEMQSPVSFYDNVEGMLQQEERLDAVEAALGPRLQEASALKKGRFR